MVNFNAADLRKYLSSLTLGVDVVDTPIVYVYLMYPMDYTQTLCIAVSGNTMLVLKAACLALKRLHLKQPKTCAATFYADVTRQVMSFVYLLDRKALVSITPVKHCEMLDCSGIIIEELTNDGLDDGVWNPKITIFSKGIPVFHDYVEWLLFSIDDKED